MILFKIADCNESIIISWIEEEAPRYAETIVLLNWFNAEENFKKYVHKIIEIENLNNITFYAHPQDFDYIISLFEDFEDLKIL